jgi:V/A-type H+-transporting ATPase subunit E
MNNLDKIIEKIDGDAASRVAATEKAAEDEVRRLKKEAKDHVADIMAKAEKTAEREEERIISRSRSAGEMRRREILLGAKVGVIDKAYDTAERFLLSLPPDQYKNVLAHLLADAVEERITSVLRLVSLYGDKEEYSSEFTAVFNEHDREACGKEVIRSAGAILRAKSESKKSVKINLAEDTADIKGGVILRCGDIESNCSVEAMIRRSHEDTGDAIAAALFG